MDNPNSRTNWKYNRNHFHVPPTKSECGLSELPDSKSNGNHILNSHVSIWPLDRNSLIGRIFTWFYLLFRIKREKPVHGGGARVENGVEMDRQVEDKIG